MNGGREKADCERLLGLFLSAGWTCSVGEGRIGLGAEKTKVVGALIETPPAKSPTNTMDFGTTSSFRNLHKTRTGTSVGGSDRT